MKLRIGDKAPDFTLSSTSGIDFTLSIAQVNRSCILYFYPKDFTPGCTSQACGFRDHFTDFNDLEVDVYGISSDSIESHLKFKNEHNLPFELLSDVNGSVTKAYGANVPFLNITKRISFLLDENHVIRHIYQNMFDAREHIKVMLQNISEKK